MKSQSKNLHKNQQGVVTIVIVILIILLMSLVVMAMSRNASREQRQALDRQLNSQAFYAAESGINRFIENYNSLGEEGKTCDNTELTGPLIEGEGSDSAVEVSCVLFDKDPVSLDYSNIPITGSKVVPIQSDDSINSLKLSFRADGVSNPAFNECDYGTNSDREFPNNPPQEDCDAGILRVDIAKHDNPSRKNLLNETYTFFAMPDNSTDGGSVVYQNQNGRVVESSCSAGGFCSVNINNLDLHQNGRMYLNVRSIYKPNFLRVEGFESSSGDPVELKNAQVLVDSTGKASDVLKRISVRKPLHALSNSPNPGFSIQSVTDVCKLLQVRPDGTSSQCSNEEF